MTDSIIDLDTHLTDASEEMWRPYFSGSTACYAPKIVDEAGTARLVVGGLMLPRPAGPGIGSPLGIGATDHVATVDDRLAFMRRHGVELTYLLPGFVGLAAAMAHEQDARRALASAHNRLVHDISEHVAEIEFVPVLLPDDEEWSLAELRHWHELTTLRAVVSRPTTSDARPFRAGLTNPVLQYLVDEKITLMLHAATGYHQTSPIADLFTDYRFTHVFSHPFEQMVALADLYGSGALSAGLRVAIIEAGCGWVPWFLHRLQEHFTHTGGCERVDVDVADLARRRLLFSVEPTDPGIAAMVSAGLGSVLGFGSDFPHWDAVDPADIDCLIDLYGCQYARAVLYDNAARFFAEAGV